MGRGGCVLCNVRSRYLRVLHVNRSHGLCGHHHRLGLLVLGGDLLHGWGSRGLLGGKLLGHDRLLEGSLLLLQGHDWGWLLLCRRIIRAKHASEE